LTVLPPLFVELTGAQAERAENALAELLADATERAGHPTP
jgi:hypothetical protein